MPLRVMTWNLWWRFGDWERRGAAIEETIGRVQPDVVCLQEVWCNECENLAAVIGRRLGYTATTGARVGRSDVGFGNAVLSRWPAEPVADEPLPRRDGRPGHRRVVAARVATPWGPWPIVSTHLDHRFDDSATRQLQALRLLERIATWRGDPDCDLPVVLGGDLNAVPDSDEIRLLTGRSDGVAGVVSSTTRAAWSLAHTGSPSRTIGSVASVNASSGLPTGFGLGHDTIT